MPLDIQLFRADSGGNPDLIRESQRRRFQPVEIVDEIIEKDAQWRRMTGEIDNLRKKRNAVQKEVATKKKAKEPCDELVAQIKSIGEETTQVENAQKALKVEIDKLVNTIGNIVDDTVPVSIDEDADNRVERKWGTPRDPAGLLNHHDLLWRIGGYEPDRGAAVAGHRGYFLKDMGVLLNQAFINYGISFLRSKNYSVLQPPYFMKKEMMAGVAQLEQFDEELYKVSGGDGEDKYLIATSEQPICGYHAGEWMDEKSLPLRYSGVSTCFRKEAGKHGKDTWGIFRVHQFEKVEQFAVVKGSLEESQKMQEEMIACAEEFYQSLGFPYHVINIVSGALNNAAIKKYDLEAWFPGYNAYRELVSCSNCTDYQSRSMEIRSGGKKLGDREKKYVHMLNATLCATGRGICCLLENYQEADGVRVPEVLVPFMGGITFMPFIRDARPMDKSDKAKAAAAAATKPAAPAAPATKPVAPPAAPPAAPVMPPSAPAISTAPAPAAPATAAAPTSTTEKPTKPKKEDKSKPPRVPIFPPTYTTPAPVESKSSSSGGVMMTASSVPSVEQVLAAQVAGEDFAALLETRLMYFSYAAGFQPGAADVTLMASLEPAAGAGASTANLALNTARWWRSVQSFTAEERAQWK
mmetsp:Transcript_23496/g.39289  ORF Transcript_23496/g.39289 Transcript_23496/m.39289 type:complete len:637 (+) Transcript_23496:61-1971(+)